MGQQWQLPRPIARLHRSHWLRCSLRSSSSSCFQVLEMMILITHQSRGTALLLSWNECLQNYDYPQRFFCPQPDTTSKRARGVNSRAHSSTCFLWRRGNYQHQDQSWNAHSSLGSVHLLDVFWLPVWVSSSCWYLGEYSLHCQVGPTIKIKSSTTS